MKWSWFLESPPTFTIIILRHLFLRLMKDVLILPSASKSILFKMNKGEGGSRHSSLQNSLGFLLTLRISRHLTLPLKAMTVWHQLFFQPLLQNQFTIQPYWSMYGPFTSSCTLVPLCEVIYPLLFDSTAHPFSQREAEQFFSHVIFYDSAQVTCICLPFQKHILVIYQTWCPHKLQLPVYISLKSDSLLICKLLKRKTILIVFFVSFWL